MDAKEYMTSEGGSKLQNVLHKELDLIQAVITRMAQNSFYMKGWCITLVAAIFSLSKKVGTVKDVAMPLAIMAAFFWVLDTNYLSLEKKYRGLYTWVLEHRLAKDDYVNLYSLDYNLAEKPVNGWVKKRIVLILRWVRVFVSWSESCLYVPLIVLLIGLNFGWWASTSNWLCRRASESAGQEVRAHETVFIGDKDIKRQDANEGVADKNGMDVDKQCPGETIVMPPQVNLVNGKMPRGRPVIRAAEGSTAKSKK